MRRRWLAGSLGLLALALWWGAPWLLPELTLTQQPREYADAAAAEPPPVSHVSLPVELPLAELDRRLAQEIDASLARKREDSDFRAWRSGPLRLQARSRVVSLTLPLSFSSHDGPNTKGSLVVTTRITADISADWEPRVSVKSSFDWTRKPKIKLLLFRVRVSGLVGRALRKKLAEMDTDLKARIETALRLEPRAEAWWQGLYEPMQLSDDPPAWLVVHPQALYFEPLSGDGENLRLMLGVRARLATRVAAQPPAHPPERLPPLQRATREDEGFALYLPVLADYRGLEAELREELAGRRIVLDRGAITPTDFRLYTSGRRLVIGVDFNGDAPGFWFDTRGTVYFTGEPRFDPQTRMLSIEQFGFTRRLNNPLLSIATWVLQDSLRTQMQRRLTWDLGERLREGALRLSEQLNQPLGKELRLSGAVEHLNLTGIECRAEGIHIGLEARGQLKVTLADSATLGQAQRADQQAQPAGDQAQAAERRDRTQPLPAQ
ncbi:MAG TPA: DUF4403 family protein [Nevskiales bacterium]|nr:DUF4403 family protein [Nevskiales bacterium]